MPNGYEVVANGRAASRRTPRGTGRRTCGRRTTRWRATSRRSTSASGRCGSAGPRPACRVIDADRPRRRRRCASARVRREPEILAFLESRFGPYPFESAAAIVPDIAAARLRPRDADRPDLLARLLPAAATRSSATNWPTSGSATSSPAIMAGHLAQRGLRHLRLVAVGRARGVRHPAGRPSRPSGAAIDGRLPVLGRRRSETPGSRTCSTAPSTCAGR